jgi:hypothetical protein
VSRVFGDFSRDVANKRKSAMPDCSQITEEKRVKLESSINCTQEEKPLKISEVDSKEKEKVYLFWIESIQEKPKKLLSCTMTDCKDLGLDFWNSSAKKLLAGSWFTAKLTEVNKQSPVKSVKSCPSSLFSLPKTIDSAVGTEKKSQKLEEKIDKKRISRGNQRTGR